MVPQAMPIERVILVTRPTRLEDLQRRFITLEQARFYLDRAGQSLDSLEREHARFSEALNRVRSGIPDDLTVQPVPREMISSFPFQPTDLVVTIGPDGLVANTVKYALETPIIAVNPDPDGIEGVLCGTEPDEFKKVLNRLLNGDAKLQSLTLAIAKASDGQTLLAVNDFFIGRKDHVSARYRIEIGDIAEHQSSSGIIISTGVGSTGWMRSILTGAFGTAQAWDDTRQVEPNILSMPWDTSELAYFVREPFPSVGFGTELVSGRLAERGMIVTSEMPQGGVIFSDGIAADAIDFHSGLKVIIGVAARSGILVSSS